MTTPTFNQINNAIQNYTPCFLTKGYCKDEKSFFYLLKDGCGDAIGDEFWELDDVLDYVCNNQDVSNHLLN